MSLQIEVKGLEEAILALGYFPAMLDGQAIPAILREAAAYGWSLFPTFTPVRTGFLLSTCYVGFQGNTLILGAGAPYAVFVNDGTRFMAARPFVEPVGREVLARLPELAIDAISRGFESSVRR